MLVCSGALEECHVASNMLQTAMHCMFRVAMGLRDQTTN